MDCEAVPVWHFTRSVIIFLDYYILYFIFLIFRSCKNTTPSQRNWLQTSLLRKALLRRIEQNKTHQACFDKIAPFYGRYWRIPACIARDMFHQWFSAMHRSLCPFQSYSSRQDGEDLRKQRNVTKIFFRKIKKQKERSVKIPRNEQSWPFYQLRDFCYKTTRSCTG